MAWWPARGSEAVSTPVFYSALFYNSSIALFLALFSVARHLGGLLLWPAVAFHAVVAVLLITTWQAQKRRTATGNSAA